MSCIFSRFLFFLTCKSCVLVPEEYYLTVLPRLYLFLAIGLAIRDL